MLGQIAGQFVQLGNSSALGLVATGPHVQRRCQTGRRGLAKGSGWQHGKTPKVKTVCPSRPSGLGKQFCWATRYHRRPDCLFRGIDMSTALTLAPTAGLTRPGARPRTDAQTEPPRLLVIHHISLPPGQFVGHDIERLFTNTLPAEGHPDHSWISQLRVSAHWLIRRDGELVQFVSAGQRARHAGASCWRGLADLQ